MRTQPLILLVDDEDVFLEIASVKLGSAGFDTVTARTGEDAIAKASSLLPDLVLSDVYMVPGPNGWELALELRRNPKTRSIKLAFFTSLRDPWIEVPREDREKVAAELGDIVFFDKADDVEVLPTRIFELIGVLAP